MSVIVVGLNHRTVPVGLLERMAVPEARLAKALHDLAATSSVLPSRDATRAALSDAQVDAMLNAAREQDRHGDHDLVAIGAAAIGGLIGTWFFSRI